MIVRRVLLAFLSFGLVACGDGITAPDYIYGFYRLGAVNGRGFRTPVNPGGFSSSTTTVNPDGTTTIDEFTGGYATLGRRAELAGGVLDGCEVGTIFTTTVFSPTGQLLGESSRTEVDVCTFEFTIGPDEDAPFIEGAQRVDLTLNYFDGNVESGSIGTFGGFTINRDGSVWELDRPGNREPNLPTLF